MQRPVTLVRHIQPLLNDVAVHVGHLRLLSDEVGHSILILALTITVVIVVIVIIRQLLIIALIRIALPILLLLLTVGAARRLVSLEDVVIIILLLIVLQSGQILIHLVNGLESKGHSFVLDLNKQVLDMRNNHVLR